MIRTESDFLQYAFSTYDNPHLSSVQEFEADLKRFTYLNNLLNRYRNDASDLKDRLILNHIVILGNCFTVPGALKLLEYKITQENRKTINSFLIYLGIIPHDVECDKYILEILDAY